MKCASCFLGFIAVLGILAGSSRAEQIGPTKWSQPPVIHDPGPPLIYYGWDELSQEYELIILVADDFTCEDPRPVADVHWWGSYLGWQGQDPPEDPELFHISFWTDVPAGEDPDPNVTWSHPGERIWDVLCEDYTEEFVGYDFDPRENMVTDSTFQYTQTLREEEYFHQELGTVYWISIAAGFRHAPYYAWGWKTRPHFFQDDAVTGGPGPGPAPWQPIEFPQGVSWDVAFELTVIPEPSTLTLLSIGVVGLLLHALRKSR